MSGLCAYIVRTLYGRQQRSGGTRRGLIGGGSFSPRGIPSMWHGREVGGTAAIDVGNLRRTSTSGAAARLSAAAIYWPTRIQDGGFFSE